MAVILLTSASGSPGVTTTTLGLAHNWARHVIVIEADPVGGSTMMAGFFAGFQQPPHCVVDLLLAHRNGDLETQFQRSLVAVEGTHVSILPGARSHAQAHHGLELWEPLHALWAKMSQHCDVLIDAGRLGMEHYPWALLKLVDVVLLLTGSDLPSLAAAKQWADEAHQRQGADPDTPPWKVVLVNPGQPYSPREVSNVLKLEVLSTLIRDPQGARVYSHAQKSVKRNRLDPHLAHCAQRITALLDKETRVANHRGES
jgi:hypothetical protein